MRIDPCKEWEACRMSTNILFGHLWMFARGFLEGRGGEKTEERALKPVENARRRAEKRDNQ